MTAYNILFTIMLGILLGAVALEIAARYTEKLRKASDNRRRIKQYTR